MIFCAGLIFSFRTLFMLTIVAGAVSTEGKDVLNFRARQYLASGYDDPSTVQQRGEIDPNRVPNLFGFGLGGLEQMAYDPIERVVYACSEQGFITLIDYGDGPDNARQLPFALHQGDTFTSIYVCPEQNVFFAATKNDTVYIYTTAKRSEKSLYPDVSSVVSVSRPLLLHQVTVGPQPDHLKANHDCSIVAVANEGEGYYDDKDGLVDPEGSISLIRGPFDDVTRPPQVDFVSLNRWTDDELLNKGIHMPLSENAMEYWDEHSHLAGEVNFKNARNSYTPATVLEPEWLVWSPDGTKVYVNLQENSALVVVDAVESVATDIFSYGLKCWDEVPIDVVEDGGCSKMQTVPGLCSLRAPDSIAMHIVNGETYILTSNEGDHVEYGAFEERKKSKNIFDGNELDLLGATADKDIFDPDSPFEGKSRFFNKDCRFEQFCSDSLRMTLGSSMVDYSDPKHPHIHNMVTVGGRGFTVYKLTSDSLDLIWDSAGEIEREGCKAYPWAHNGVQDEEFAPLDGELYQNLASSTLRAIIEEMNDPNRDGCFNAGNGSPGACPLGRTVDDRSLKDGPALESMTVGEACGIPYMVTVSEKNSVGYLYSIEDISNPNLVQIFHLSEVSRTKSPGVAYNDRTLGEIDAESILFLSESESPTGKAAVLFAGAWSATLSFWEFDCGDDTNNSVATRNNDITSDGGCPCAGGDSCTYGTATCCGETHPEIMCTCTDDGSVECRYTDACSQLNCGDCVGSDTMFDAGHGDCSTYAKGHSSNNHIYCLKDMDAVTGILAEEVCSECGSCYRAPEACIKIDTPFNTQNGGCETYVSGHSSNNAYFCSEDLDSNGIYAYQACAECGKCRHDIPVIGGM